MLLPEPIQIAASACLHELFPKWMSQALIDQRRTVRPQGNGSATIHIEPYRGVGTTGKFYGIVNQCCHIAQLEEAIGKYSPVLLNYMATPGSSRKMEVENLVIGWLKFMEANQSTKDISTLIAEALSNFSEILDKDCLTCRMVTALSGISLPDEITEIQLDDNLVLRKLTVGELTELGSHDIYSTSANDPLRYGVTSCIEKLVDLPLKFSSDSTPLPYEANNMHEEVIHLMLALHVLKPGRANAFLTSTFTDNSAIDLGGTTTSAPIQLHPHASFEINLPDIEELLSIYKSLKECKRSEVIIAAGRLLDSEHRLSPVDALLDSIIGLEVILNPSDIGELSFRVALNYAYLDSPSSRRKRYESLKSVQVTRNKVVHGGLNMSSTNSNLIVEHAEIGKSCLRDALKRFLVDPMLKDGPKLSAAFWLDRILPPDETHG